MKKSSTQTKTHNEARRHFLGLAAAVGARAAAAGAVLTSMPFSAHANNGRGWGAGGTPPGNGRGHPKCFLRGTMIETDKGERPIETIAIGERVRTADGPCLPVKWIARQSHQKSGEQWDPGIAPIRVCKFALDDATPRRDLLLSPAHRMMIDGYLIEVANLVNGMSITVEQPSSTKLEYFHVLLDRHAVILAEGAPTASLQFEPGSLNEFSNAAEYEELYGVASTERMAACAPTLGVGGKEHLKALLRIGMMPLVTIRDPMADIHERIASRGELLLSEQV
jgi:hypothetical protein